MIIAPCASGRDGSRISARLRWICMPARAPWLRMMATPATADSSTSASVGHRPIRPPTWMNSAISMIGTTRNMAISRM